MVRTRQFCARLAVVTATLFTGASIGHAATRTWDGGGTPVLGDFLWSDVLNWDGDLTSPVGSDSLTFGGTLGAQQLNDLTADTVFNGITFNTASGPFTIAGNRFMLGGDLTDLASGAQAIKNDIILSDNRTISVRAGGASLGGGSLILSGVISDGGSGKGLTLVNNTLNRLQVGLQGVYSNGTLTLTGANTYTGATVVQTGGLILDYSAATAPTSNIISASSALTLGATGLPTAVPGTGTLTITGNAGATNSQSFASTTIARGANFVNVTSGAGGTTNVNLGAISRNAGGAVNFVLPTTGAIAASGTLSNGILGGWATVGPVGAPTDWATIDGGNVVSLSSVGGGYTEVTGTPAIANGPATNVRWTASSGNATVGAGTTDINSLLYTENVARSITVTGTLRLGAQGGIFRSYNGLGAQNQLTITGGTLTAGGAASTPGEITLMVNQGFDATLATNNNNNNNNNAMTVASIIADNGTGFPVSVVKTGRGGLALNGANTYSGGTYVNDGRVQLGNAAALGTGPVYINPGGHVFWNSGTNSNNYFVAGLGSIENAGNFGAIRFNNAGAMAGTLTLTGDSRLTSTNGGSTVSGKITGNYNLEFGADLGTGTAASQILTISNTTNDWNGTTTINRGTLRLGNNEVIPHGASAGNVVFDWSGTTNNAAGAILDLRGRNETINGLSTAGTTPGNSQVVNNVAGTFTLTVGANNSSGNFAGGLLDGGGVGKLAVAKTGTGIQTFSGVNFHTGGTTVSDGTLVFTGGAGVAASGPIAVTNTSGQTALTALASTSGLVVGQSVTGTGIPANSYISAIISGTAIAINNNTTAAATSVSFGAGGSALGTGPVNVAGPGTLNVSGVTGGATLANGQTLTNNGTVVGGVTAPTGSTIKGTGTFNNTITLNGSSATVGGTINPGNSVGTLTADSVTVGTGGFLTFEIDGATADVLNVTNTATLAGSGITMSILNPATQPFYDILTAGTLASMPVLNTPSIGRTLFSLSNPTANSIRVNVTGGPASVRWTGTDGTNPTRWESTQLDTNWITSDPVTDTNHYYDGDFVTFNDTDNGGTNYTVAISGTVSPGSTTVNNSAGDYVLGGTGVIAGNGSLTKSGTRNLTLSTANTYSGGTVVNTGRVNVNNASAIGSGTLTINGGAIDNSTGAAITLSTNNAQVWTNSFEFTGTQSLNLGTGAVTLNANPTITVNANTLTVGGSIGTGTGNSITKEGAGTLTLSAANAALTGSLNINNGAVRLGNLTSAGTSTVTVGSGATVVAGAAHTNAFVLSGGTFGSIAPTSNFTFTGNFTATAATNSTIRLSDPQNLPGAAVDVNNVVITGSLNGSGNVTVLSNGQDNNPDGGNGFRLQGAGASTYSGTLTFGNNVKGEIQTTVAGPFSPVGTGKIVLTAGDMALADTLPAATTTGGYTTLNMRNNSSGSTVFGNDVEITGTGTVVLNPLGSAPAGTTITMGNLRVGTGQEVAVYLGAAPDHPVVFPTVTLTGSATFSPKKPGYGVATTPSADLVLGDISETVASNITMNGARTLYLTGTGGYSGTTTINNVVVSTFTGTLQVGGIGGGPTGALGAGNVINNGVLTFFRTNAYTASNNISGTGAVDKRGGDVLTLTGTNSYAGKTAVLTGTLLVNGTHTGAGNYNVSAGATLGGTGTITPAASGTIAVDAGGIIAPGASIGPLTIDGSVAAGAVLSPANGALFGYELGASNTSDRLVLTNAAAGDIAFNTNTINFTDTTSGALAPGDYTLFLADAAGAYAGLTVDGSSKITAGLSIGTGLAAYNAATSLRQVGNNINLNLVVLPGDYNANGFVDAADYVVWRDNDGTSNSMLNDATPGTVDSTDYDLWRANFGNSFPGSGGSTNAPNVPEPTSVMLALMVAGALALAGRRRQLSSK